MQYTLQDILRDFDHTTYSRGNDYERRGKVEAACWADDDYIEGEVGGSGGQVYLQSIELSDGRHGIEFSGDCSCPVGFNCKHVVAVLLSCLGDDQPAALTPAPARPAGEPLPQLVSAWLQRVAAAAAPLAPASKPAKPTHRLIYVLMPAIGANSVSLSLCKARLRARGEIASASLFSDTYSLMARPPAYVSRADLYLAQLFMAMCASSDTYGVTTEPKDEIGAQLLRMLQDAGALYWAADRADLRPGLVRPVQPGVPRVAALGWRAQQRDGDTVRLGWQDGAGAPLDYILPTEPAMYFHQGELGQLTLDEGARALTIKQLQTLVTLAPPVAGRDRMAVARQMMAQGLERIVPMPQSLQQITRDDIKPRPFLLLGSIEDEVRGVWHDFGLLAFDYDGKRIARLSNQPLTRPTDAGTELIVRDQAAERAAADTLTALGFAPPGQPDSPLHDVIGALELGPQDAWLHFDLHQLPQLRAEGWLIEQTDDYRFDVSAIDDWYAEVDDGGEGGNAWFELELGIVVNQVRVSLLPVLVQLIRNAPQDFNPAALDAHGDSDTLIASLPDGTRVALPWGRIKPILATLGELYFSDKIGTSIRLPALDAARLAELEANAQLRWMGGQHLRDIGRKLGQFDGVQSVAAPLGLQADLRQYQSEGLAWMQFLREYDLAGILADDMGLGKTIQTLAHILLEKEAGRLDAPALVVAPTSLMGNWQAEAARFAPDLRVLLLHGVERLTRFDDIGQFDLVLTTYALLPRDEDKLREHRYHLVILDESQYIKNSRSKAAQTAALLRARHRLCLTGTPLQNHLGELWSQFHFLLPGLLGDEKGFNSDFRKPIEKLGDSARNTLLIRRIKPFLLRRTKDKVAKELPVKTEMVRDIELSGAQRDLYETVRLAMDKKVRAEIAKKGVARSQIVILEALLKLRQVCCDPRLVKSAGAKAAGTPSAKLNELMEMIEELLDEGRKILVFSQFTGMLALIEDELRARAIAYALLTGATKDRAAQVDAFQQGSVPLFLISLKAGGVGLNLTAADTVIHYDPWWNPAAENQATDRAWRIGQDKPVFVYKLIAKGTLEEKIQEMQRKKGDLADAVLAEGEAHKFGITQDDLHAIFAPL